MIDWKKIKVLIIDLDETLCNSYDAFAWPARHYIEKQMEEDGFGEYVKVIHESKWYGGFENTMKDANVPEDVGKKYRILYDNWVFEALDDERGDAFVLYPNVLDLLKLPLTKVLLTRGNVELQNKKIDHLKIREYFDDFSLIHTFESKKDELLKILEKQGVAKDEALIIGDRLVDEITHGNELGIPTVFVQQPGQVVEISHFKPDLVVESLKTVVEKLK